MRLQKLKYSVLVKIDVINDQEVVEVELNFPNNSLLWQSLGLVFIEIGKRFTNVKSYRPLLV